MSIVPSVTELLIHRLQSLEICMIELKKRKEKKSCMHVGNRVKTGPEKARDAIVAMISLLWTCALLYPGEEEM